MRRNADGAAVSIARVGGDDEISRRGTFSQSVKIAGGEYKTASHAYHIPHFILLFYIIYNKKFINYNQYMDNNNLNYYLDNNL